MVLVVQRTDAVQDLDGLGEARLVDEHRLETTLERGVLLDVLAVLVERGCADALNLTARERGLENVRGIDGAFGGARTDQGVQLVDEEDDLTRRADLVEDLLQALLEFAAVLRAGDERAHVECEHALAHQRLGDVAEDDLLRKAFRDRRLADAGLADERRVVLRAAAEDLHDTLDLHRTSDDRIERVLDREVGEVAAELIKQRCLRRLLLGLLGLLVDARLVEQLVDLAANLLEVCAEVLEDVGRDALTFDEQAEQQVLRADVVVAHASRLFKGDLDDLLDARRRDDLLDDDALVATEHRLNRAAHLVDLHAEVIEDLGRKSLALTEQTEQQMLCADVRVMRTLRLLLRKREHLLRPFGEALERVQNRLHCPSGLPEDGRGQSPGTAVTLPIMPGPADS